MKTASSSAAFEVAVPAEKKLMKKENSSIPAGEIRLSLSKKVIGGLGPL